MKASKWNLQYDIPWHLRSIIQQRFGHDTVDLVSKSRAEAWDTLYLVSAKIKNELKNELINEIPTL